ncbi:MAG: hypothetical protein II961_08200 [Candidatus Riflebacteria bacterium]|nr:hypothetical protein [Candidatus Riflebacteria bacterium]
MKKKAISFLEIIIAVSVMAIAMIPIFGMLSRQTVETDKNASQAFAINKATEVLNTILDNVSFVAIREGNPGYIRVDDLPKNDKYSELDDSWARKMASMLFNSTSKEANGYPCRGIVTDSKGISYLIHLRVEDVVSTTKHSKPERMKIGGGFPDVPPDDFNEQSEINFSFLKNPTILSSPEWTQTFAETPDETGKPFTELELLKGVSESQVNFYTDEILNLLKGNTKYGYVNPTAERYTARMVMSKVPYKVEENMSWCPFKRLIIQVQWNLEPNYYSDPENPKGNTQRIHLIAIKGDIDS